MANKKNGVKDSSRKNKRTIVKNSNLNQNSIVMKFLVFLGVVVLFVALLYLMNYFFVEKSYIKINMSTDKEFVYLTIDNDKKLITTQKYVSDLNYSMRYDIDNFEVFKYKKQDIYKYLDEDKVMILVEKSSLPNSCNSSALDSEYNNCYIEIDDYSEEYYISNQGQIYKITIKSPNTKEYDSEIKARIDYMLNSFEISK